MLKRIQEPEAWEPQINQVAFEALDMAIEALSQESSEDVISRQAAIDAVLGVVPYDEYWKEQIEKAVNALPSAQPVITCDGCKFVGTYDTDFPCCNCIRREKDYYAQE